MNLKKHLGAKIAALVTSLAALGGVLALVHQNPPPAAADAAATSPSTTATPARGAAPRTAAPAPKRQTRTHVS